MTKHNVIKNLIKHFGTQEDTARALKVTQPAVSAWLRGAYGMSAVTAIRAERVTDGKFPAVELCPDLAA